jgi:hypothetical protein
MMRKKSSLYMTAIALAGSVLLAAVPASAQRGGHGGHGGGAGPAAHVSGGPSIGGGRSFGGANFGGRMSGGPSVGVRTGGNWNGGNRGWNGARFASRTGGSVTANTFAGNRSLAFRDGRFHDGRRNFRRGFGPAFGLGYGYGYPNYDYGYYDDLYAYSDDSAPDYAYTDGAVVGADNSASCAARFRSYDPTSGTYLGYDGLRHPCP